MSGACEFEQPSEPVTKKTSSTPPSACRGCPLCSQGSRRSQRTSCYFDHVDRVQPEPFLSATSSPPRYTLSEPLQNFSVGRSSKPTPLQKRPKRIILVRHGQSEGNVDASVFTREADWRVPLTDLGMQQAEACGKRIRDLIEKAHQTEEGDDGADWGVFFYVSPYTRTLETLRGIGRAFEQHRILGVREEPRLREQDFGNFQVQERMEMTKDARERFGKFFFRFPEGESAADVYDRVTGFLDSFWRDIEWGRMHPSLRVQGSSTAGSVADAAVRACKPLDPTELDLRYGRRSSAPSFASRGAVEGQEGTCPGETRLASNCSSSNGTLSGGAEATLGTRTEGGHDSCVFEGLQRASASSSPNDESPRGNGREGGQSFSENRRHGCATVEQVAAIRQALAAVGLGRRGFSGHNPGASLAPAWYRRGSDGFGDGAQMGGRRRSVNVVMVTHGLTSRVFLMRWFRWTVAQFEGLWNPKNCEIRAMQLTSGGRYSLALQHTDDEMLTWGFSPCMVADQHARTQPDEEAEATNSSVPSWASFFDHLPRGNCRRGTIENDRDHLTAPPNCLDSPI